MKCRVCYFPSQIKEITAQILINNSLIFMREITITSIIYFFIFWWQFWINFVYDVFIYLITYVIPCVYTCSVTYALYPVVFSSYNCAFFFTIAFVQCRNLHQGLMHTSVFFTNWSNSVVVKREIMTQCNS